jgi:hypothetical protein
MDIGTQILSPLQRVCPVCRKVVTYTLVQNRKRKEGKACRSCANSISMGGHGNCFPTEGTRTCSACKEVKSLNDFTWVKAKQRHESICKTCKRIRLRTYNRNFYRFRKLGIDFSIDQYNAMLADQNLQCKICQCKLDDPCVDHCHTTGKVRGLLCRKCNAAIGSLGDCPERLETAAKYLRGEL